MDVTSLEITVAMFSGRPDPAAVVRGDAATALLERLAPGEPVDPAQPHAWRPRLGYRGLVIRQMARRASERADGLPGTFRLCGGRLVGPGLRHRVADPSVEDYLCSADGPAGTVLEAAELAVLRADLAGPLADNWWRPPAPAPQAGEPGAVRPCPGAPAPEFAEWNDALARSVSCTLTGPRWCRQCTNNSYNYATSIRTDSRGWPGLASRKTLVPWEITASRVRRYAFYDGLIDTPAAGFDDMCIGRGGILVALAVAPGHDFTWYRKNSDGYWGHKIGSEPATDLDNKRARITDPRTCDRGIYTEFGGFMTVIPGHVRIAGFGMPPSGDPLALAR